MPELRVAQVRFTAASPGDQATGLIGYVSCILGDVLHLDGLVVRRTADGRLALAFPARRDASGRKHFFLRPLNDAARREIEAQIFRALNLVVKPP